VVENSRLVLSDKNQTKTGARERSVNALPLLKRSMGGGNAYQGSERECLNPSRSMKEIQLKPKEGGKGILRSIERMKTGCSCMNRGRRREKHPSGGKNLSRGSGKQGIALKKSGGKSSASRPEVGSDPEKGPAIVSLKHLKEQ